jgi:hypothetical protein
MAFKLSDRISNCLERASSYRERANKEPDPRLKQVLKDMEQHWRNLAQSYEITERLSRDVDERAAGTAGI